MSRQYQYENINWYLAVVQLYPVANFNLEEARRLYSQLEHLNALRQRGVENPQIMVFKRNWDTCCPHVWDSWEADGVTWVIRDLRPEDDDRALEILLEHMCRDELLCSLSGMTSDPISMRAIEEFWRSCISQRMSLGCYEEIDGNSKLVALNVCVVECQGDKLSYAVKGKAFKNFFGAMRASDKVYNVYELLGVNMVLYGFGLIVSKEYRGMKLGSRILAAREPLALHHCILATSTVFSGPASQKSAERVGFSTVLTITMKELAESGLDYPKDDTKNIKLMVKKYDAIIERSY